MERLVQKNPHGYNEVSLPYRKRRAAFLDAKKVDVRTNRIVCPMLDAARSKAAYGEKFLPGLKNADLVKWANALNQDSNIKNIDGLVKMVAYAADKWYQILPNAIKGSFDDKGVNTGFIHTLKNGVHTGIFQNGMFNQDKFNEFVWTIHPDLKGVNMDNDYLYSSSGDALYFTKADLQTVINYNLSQRPSKRIGLGEKLSSFEMEKLLLGIIGQRIIIEEKKIQAILIRDIHDLYKYGLVTAHIEDQLKEANLLTMPSFNI